MRSPPPNQKKKEKNSWEIRAAPNTEAPKHTGTHTTATRARQLLCDDDAICASCWWRCTHTVAQHFPTLLLPCTPLFDYTRLQMRRPVQNGHPPQSQPPTAAVEIFAQFEFQPLPPSPPLVWGTPLLIWLEIKKHLNGISLASPAAAAAAKIGMINVLVFVILFIVQISPKKNEEKLFKFYRMYKTHFL